MPRVSRAGVVRPRGYRAACRSTDAVQPEQSTRPVQPHAAIRVRRRVLDRPITSQATDDVKPAAPHRLVHFAGLTFNAVHPCVSLIGCWPWLRAGRGLS